VVIAAGKAGREHVGDDRSRDEAADVVVRRCVAVPAAGVVAAFGGHVGGRRLAGVSREDLDGAARCVAAEQRALRSLQHFHALHVGQVDVEQGLGGLVDAVDVERVGIFRSGGAERGGNPTDRRLGGGALPAEGEAGHDRLQVADGVHPGAREVGARNRVDGERHVLQPLLPALRGDDDLVQRHRTRGGPCLRRRNRGLRRGDIGEGQQAGARKEKGGSHGRFPSGA